MMNPIADPSAHLYLGEQHELTPKITDYELRANEQYEMLLLPVQELVVFPGDTLPLRLQNPHFVRQLLETVQRAQQGNECVVPYIGVVQAKQLRGPRVGQALATHGTTLQLFSTHNQAAFESEEVILKSRAKHRFEILSVKSERGVHIAKVRILSDASFAPRLQKHRGQESIPRWVYTQRSPQRLARAVFFKYRASLLDENKETNALLKKWGPYEDVSDEELDVCAIKAERDPVGFSYYMASNLVLSSNLLQGFLDIEDDVQRLLLILKMLEQNEKTELKIGCLCGQKIALKSQLFNLPGAEGVAGAYVNRHGVIHQTMTVRKMLDSAVVMLHGGPCTQDSWFPGYAWTIAYCGVCFNHLGWKFTRARFEDGEDDENWETASEGDEEEDEEEHGGDEMEEDGEESVEGIEDGEGSMVVEDVDESEVEGDPDRAGRESVQSTTGMEEERDEDGVVQCFWGLRRNAIKEIK